MCPFHPLFSLRFLRRIAPLRRATTAILLPNSLGLLSYRTTDRRVNLGDHLKLLEDFGPLSCECWRPFTETPRERGFNKREPTGCLILSCELNLPDGIPL